MAEEENKKEDKVECVKIITRTKAPVCNWEDLEQEIIKGSV